MPQTPHTFLQLVYASSATVLFSADELKALLEHSRRKNEAAGLSGLLLYHDGNFMQLLEGEENQVRATYDRIKKDPRHFGCLLLLTHQVTERSFPNWSMGFRDFASPEMKATPGYNSFLDRQGGKDVFPTNPTHAISLLRTFRSNLR